MTLFWAIWRLIDGIGGLGPKGVVGSSFSMVGFSARLLWAGGSLSLIQPNIRISIAKSRKTGAAEAPTRRMLHRTGKQLGYHEDKPKSWPADTLNSSHGTAGNRTLPEITAVNIPNTETMDAAASHHTVVSFRSSSSKVNNPSANLALEAFRM